MGYLLLVGLVGLFSGVFLGVFCMALLAAADRNRFPAPSPMGTPAMSTSWQQGSTRSWAGLMGNRCGSTVIATTDATDDLADTTAREYA